MHRNEGGGGELTTISSRVIGNSDVGKDFFPDCSSSSSASVAEKRLIFERLSNVSRKTTLVVEQTSVVGGNNNNASSSSNIPPPKPKRTFAQDHYFSLNNVDTPTNTVRKNVEKLNFNDQEVSSVISSKNDAISISSSSSIQQPARPKLIVCRPIVKRWNTATSTTNNNGTGNSSKKIVVDDFKTNIYNKNCRLHQNSSSDKVVSSTRSTVVQNSSSAARPTVTQLKKRPKYFQLSHEYEQIFADRRPASSYEKNFIKRSASLEEIYSSPIPVCDRLKNSNTNNNLLLNNTKQQPSLYYCSSPVPVAPPRKQREVSSSLHNKKPSSDFITPLTSRQQNQIIIPSRPKRSLRSNVVKKDSSTKLLFRDNNNQQQQQQQKEKDVEVGTTLASSSKFYSPTKVDEIRKLNSDNESEEEDDDDDNNSTSSKDKEIELRVTRARVVRRQTLMHYDQQETAFKRRKSPQLFELAALIELRPNDRTNPIFSGKFVPAISYKFPQTVPGTSDTLLASLPCLCYPDVNKAKPKNPKDFLDEFFVITITDQLGDRKFAYCCRYVPIWRASSFDEGENEIVNNSLSSVTDSNDITLPSLPQVLCVVTPVQAAQFYLDFVREGAVRAKMNLIALNEFLRVSFYKPLPPAGGRLVISGAGLVKEVMLVNRSGSLRGHGLGILLERMTIENIMILFASLLSERRVLIVGDTVPTVSKIVQASTMMLFPFEWPHTLIPVIPDSYVQLCFSPTPYLIGVLRSNLHELKHLLVGKNSDGEEEDYILIYDLDYGILKDRDSNLCSSSSKSPTHSSAMDESHRFLPSKVARTLKQMLKSTNIMSSSGGASPSTVDGKVSESFMTAFVELVGHYCEFVVTQQDGHLTFQKQNFIQSVSSKSHKMFLKWFVETGMFQIWIKKRLDSAGNKQNDDVFEKKVSELKNNTAAGSDLFGSVAKRMASFLKTRK